MSKRPITKFPCPVFLMIAKDCTERLSAVALSMHRPHYSSPLMRLGSRCPSEFFFSDTSLRYLDRDCVGTRRTGTRHGNDYHSVREKHGIVVYRLHVLQTVTSLRVVSLVFRGQDLLTIANTNPQQEARFMLWKKLIPRESGGDGV